MVISEIPQSREPSLAPNTPCGESQSVVCTVPTGQERKKEKAL